MIPAWAMGTNSMILTDRFEGWQTAGRFVALAAILGPLLAACATHPSHGATA